VIHPHRFGDNKRISGRCCKAGFTGLLGLCLLLVFTPAHAKNPDAIIGMWLSQQKNVGIEIYRLNGKYAGKIAWFKEPNYRLTDVRGMGGKIRIDRENPDPAKRNRPLLGMNLMWNFTFSGNQIWENGYIYDPLYGNTYCGKITFEPPDTLKVRGYMLFTLIGKVEILTRVHEWPQTADPAVKPVERSPSEPVVFPGKLENSKPTGHKPTNSKSS